jgi:hypothetical protein
MTLDGTDPVIEHPPRAAHRCNGVGYHTAFSDSPWHPGRIAQPAGAAAPEIIMSKLQSMGWIVAALVVALCGTAPAAQASTIVTAIFEGTIRGGNDAGHHFGGVLNAGDAFSVTSVFDTGLGTYSSAGGGSISGGGHATLSIHGQDFTFALEPSSYKFDALGNIQLFLGDTAHTFLSLAFFATGLPGSILTAFDRDCVDVANGFCSGTFEISGSGGSSGAAIDAGHLSVSIATTPLPATLPLFGAALAGLGLVARRRARS